MTSYLSVAGVALCWAATLYKVVDLWTNRTDRILRYLCGTMTLLALSMSILLPPVFRLLDSLAGQTNVAQFAGNAVGVTAGAYGLLFLQRLTHPPSRSRSCVTVRMHRVVALLTVLLMALFFTFIPNLPEAPNFWSNYPAVPHVAAYRLTYLTYMGFVVLNVAILSWRYARTAAVQLAMRLGLATVTLGAFFGIMYAAVEAIRILALLVQVPALTELPMPSVQFLSAATATLIALGATMPSWGSRIGMDRAWSFIRAYQCLNGLYFLWRTLCDARPQVALDAIPPFLLDALNPLHVRYRLYRRVVEIRDAMALLRPAIHPQAAATARVLCLRRGLEKNDVEAIVVAVQLASALRPTACAREEGDPSTEFLLPNPNGDLSTDVGHLLQVADAYRRSPAVASALRLLNRSTGPLTDVRGHRG